MGKNWGHIPLEPDGVAQPLGFKGKKTIHK